MLNFIMGLILGVVVSTVGFTGIAEVADSGVQKIQNTVKDTAK